MAPLKPGSDGVGQDARPSLGVGQLLRSSHQSSEERGDAGEHALGPGRATVCARDALRRLATVTRAFGDAGQQKGAAGDRLQMLVGYGETVAS